MGLLSAILMFLVRTLGGLLFWAVLLRFLLQLARADFYNPISQSLVRITNPLLKPLRRLIPGVFGIDAAALVLALAIQIAMISALLALRGIIPFNVVVVILWAFVACLVTIVNIYYLAMLATIILSWVAAGSHHPAVVLIHQLAEPVLAPFRRLLPAMGGIDFSPMIAFVAIYVVQIVLQYLCMYVGLSVRAQWGLLLLNL
jgi:YggT family protein